MPPDSLRRAVAQHVDGLEFLMGEMSQPLAKLVPSWRPYMTAAEKAHVDELIESATGEQWVSVLTMTATGRSPADAIALRDEARALDQLNLRVGALIAILPTLAAPEQNETIDEVIDLLGSGAAYPHQQPELLGALIEAGLSMASNGVVEAAVDFARANTDARTKAVALEHVVSEPALPAALRIELFEEMLRTSLEPVQTGSYGGYQTLGTLPRSFLFERLEGAAGAIAELGGTAGVAATVDAIIDVSGRWP